MSYENKLSAKDWETLQMSFFAAFYGVAAIDGKVDEKETAAFSKEISEALLYKNPLVREVLASLARDLSTALKKFQLQNTLEYLKATRQVLETQVGEEDRDNFKRVLFGISVKIANASGGGLFGMGSKISKDEKTALAAIANTLQIKL